MWNISQIAVTVPGPGGRHETMVQVSADACFLDISSTGNPTIVNLLVADPQSFDMSAPPRKLVAMTSPPWGSMSLPPIYENNFLYIGSCELPNHSTFKTITDGNGLVQSIEVPDTSPCATVHLFEVSND